MLEVRVVSAHTGRTSQRAAGEKRGQKSQQKCITLKTAGSNLVERNVELLKRMVFFEGLRNQNAAFIANNVAFDVEQLERVVCF